jgi:DNA-binding XRE family transcriptional regulator
VSAELPRLHEPPKGSEIQAFRKRTELGADELATILGIDRATVYRWEVDVGRLHAPVKTYKGPHDSMASRVLGWLLRQNDEQCAELKILFDQRRAEGRLDIIIFELIARCCAG